MWPQVSNSRCSDESDLNPAKRQKILRTSWNEQNMADAINSCMNTEMGLDEASIVFNVPRTALRIHLWDKKKVIMDQDYKVFVLPTVPVALEQDLVALIQDLQVGSFVVAPIDIRRLGYQLASEKYMLNNLPVEKHCLLGNLWYKNFTTKYPYLDIDNRLKLNCPKTKSQHFFNNLELLINRHKINSANLFSLDVIDLKYKPPTDIGTNNANNRCLQTNPKVLCCFSSAGAYIPPMFIKSNDTLANIEQKFIPTEFIIDEKTKNELKLTAEDTSKIKKQIKTYLNKVQFPLTEEKEEELREILHDRFTEFKNKHLDKCDSSRTVLETTFRLWLDHFVQSIKPEPDKRIILMVNDKINVKNWQILKYCQMYGIVLITLPCHNIHKIHPLDGFVIALNRNLSVSTASWLTRCKDDDVEIPMNLIFKEAYIKTCNAVIAKNGFLFSGIWPVNRTVFSTNELGGESVLHQTNLTLRLEEQPQQCDIKRLCRVCMKEKTYMKSLFEPTLDYHAKKILDLTNIQVSVEDRLPQNICQYCSIQLRDAHKIRSNAIENHAKLRRLKEYLDKGWFENEVQLGSFQGEGKTRSTRIITSNFNIHSLCRICMEEKSLMSFIFQPSSLDLFNKIVDVTHLKVDAVDGLSSFLCQSCRVNINNAYDLVSKLKFNNEKLQEYAQMSAQQDGG